MSSVSRRHFFQGAVLAASATRVMGANDRVHVGIIGLGGRGSDHLKNYTQIPTALVTGLCDVNQAARERAQAHLTSGGAEKATEYDDMRKMFADKNIDEVSRLSIDELAGYLGELTLSDRERAIAGQVLKEINQRLRFLLDVGLDYLTLSRSAGSLSGGEAQRIRLATQIGSGLTGVLYVLDEPSIGLHQRDNRRLIETLLKLRDLGNTLIVVEHDEDTIRSADHVVDIGPGAG